MPVRGRPGSWRDRDRARRGREAAREGAFRNTERDSIALPVRSGGWLADTIGGPERETEHAAFHLPGGRPPHGAAGGLCAGEPTARLGLEHNILDAVRRWKYEPAIHQGKPIKAMLNLAINFKLSDEEG